MYGVRYAVLVAINVIGGVAGHTGQARVFRKKTELGAKDERRLVVPGSGPDGSGWIRNPDGMIRPYKLVDAYALADDSSTVPATDRNAISRGSVRTGSEIFLKTKDTIAKRLGIESDQASN